MNAYTAIVATTNLLPNGHQFTRDGLEQMAVAYRARLQIDPYLNFNHRYNRPPVARVLKSWVAEHPSDPAEFALHIEFEILDNADPLEVERQFATGALSLAFFGVGIGNVDEDETPDLLIGFSPRILAGEAAFEREFGEARQVFPRTRIAVREYHQHAADPATAVILVVSAWLLDKIGSNMVDLIWKWLFERPDSPSKSADLLKIHVQSEHGEVNIEMPVSAQNLEMQKALTEALVEAIRCMSTPDGSARTSLSYDERYEPTVHRIPAISPRDPVDS